MAIEMTSPRSPNHGLNLFVLGSGCSQLFHLGHRGAQSSLQVLCGGGLWTASWAPFSTNVCHHYVVSIVMGFPNSSINGGTSKAGWLVDFMENPIYTNGWWLRVPLWLRKPPCISMSSSPFPTEFVKHRQTLKVVCPSLRGCEVLFVLLHFGNVGG